MATPASASTQACPACGTLVETSAIEPLAQVACPNCGAKMRIERAYDHFQVLETLGVGGMGSVYKARDTRLDRMVALKLLRRDLSADPAEAARLEQEARATAAVNHPHVVQVYSAGHAHDQIYLVMELIEHGSLDDLMAAQPRLPEAQVLHAGLQVAKGLEAAHARGLIHRDVKPANILFADAGTAKIGDFGLAVLAGQDAEAAREIWGTPYYVAPERLNNEPEDFRSDIYSLGATLFHALAGRPPIEGETTSASELRRLKNEVPDLRALVPKISRPTAELIARMLALDPAGRFASYRDLIAALESALVATVKPQPSRSLFTFVLALVVIFVLGAVGTVIFFALTKPAPALAPTPAPLPTTTPTASATPAATSALTPTPTSTPEEDAEALAQQSAQWQRALTEARSRIAAYDFSAALASLTAPELRPPQLLAAQELERRKIQWLIEWKKRLIADLNTGGNHTLITRPPAIEYDGVARATEDELILRVPGVRGGEVAMKWTALLPPELFEISKSFIGDDPRYAERQWLAAIFALATGQKKDARERAEIAAQGRREYREAMETFFPPER